MPITSFFRFTLNGLLNNVTIQNQHVSCKKRKQRYKINKQITERQLTSKQRDKQDYIIIL